MRRLQVLCCLLLLGLSGCGGFFVPQTGGGGGGGGNTGDYLYVANSNNTFLAGFGVASSGALSVLSGSPYNNSVAAQSLAVTPANTFLYAATTNGIYVYGINSNGSIAVQNDGSPSAQDVIATAMQVDSTGNYLLAAGISTAQQVQAIAIYTINTTTGLLTPVAGSPLALYTGNASTPTVVAPTGLLITPNNAYVYASLGPLGVQVLTLGSGGALAAGATPTLLLPFSKSTSPLAQQTASDPNSLFLFVAETNTGLRVLSIGAGGSLSEIAGSPYAVGTGPRAVSLDATGSYVYVANFGSNNISAFTLTPASGKLTAIAGSPFSSGGQMPIGIVNDNSKKFVAVINSGSNGSGGNSDVQIFKFDTTTDGKLVPVATATTGTDPTNPNSIAATH
ncbi:MAG TPA: beta-propeller fold lactonase family protein [Acidobacteriaceae bacterium]|nr:beta-propeller fold lactonase family protein [Acidobacteriaceae bacterium]